MNAVQLPPAVLMDINLPQMKGIELAAHLKEMRPQLFIIMQMIRTHIRNIYEKLHVRSRMEAILKFLGQSPAK